MRKKNLLIAGIAITVALISYKIAMPAQAQSQKEKQTTPIENGINLPTHPGKLADLTRIGIDTNNNGVRDEVEIYIANKYGSDKEKFQNIMDFAKKKQSFLHIPLEDEQAAKKYNIWADSSSCLSKKLGIEISHAASINNDLTAQIYNTLERQIHFQDIMLKSDQLQNEPKEIVCE